MRAAWGSRRDAVLACLAEPRTKADLMAWGGRQALHAAWYLKRCGLVECEQVSRYVYVWRAKPQDQNRTNDGGTLLMSAWKPNAELTGPRVGHWSNDGQD